MEHYDFDEIRRQTNCLELAHELGLQPDQRGRCAATWRNGANPNSVHIEPDKWFDHGANVGGGPIDLYAVVRHGAVTPDAIQLAQEALGRRARLEPKRNGALRKNPNTTPTRYDALLADGYTEAARYTYTDADGEPIYQVVRLQHPERPKQFLQCKSDGHWGLNGVTRVLYNLPAIVTSPYVIIVEGEKDADLLISWGLPATTNSGGAKSWEPHFNAVLAGKDVWILPDNDPAGIAHANLIARGLAGVAKSLRVITLSSEPKGDVSDWASAENGNAQRLLDCLRVAPHWTEPDDDSVAVGLAIEANKEPFKNYEPLKIANKSGGFRIVKQPRSAESMIQDLRRRLLGFPRVIGKQTLFDQDRRTGQIHILDTPSALIAWIRIKTGNHVVWANAQDLSTKEEFFKALQTPHDGQFVYDAISRVPDWPARNDVFYQHPPIPPPTDGFSAFYGLADRFNFTTTEDRALYISCLLESLRYDPGAAPLWIFGSPDGPGSGKTTAADMLALLLDQEPIRSNPRQIKEHADQLNKSLVSASGREKRVLLFDNVTGKFRSDELAALITMKQIGERPAYGKEYEQRKNDLTIIATSNGATIDTDLATRAVFIDFDRPARRGNWQTETEAYINQNRQQILGDMIGLFAKYGQSNTPIRTRFPGWESISLWAASAGNADLHAAAITLSTSRAQGSNEDEDLAEAIHAALLDKLRANWPDAYASLRNNGRVYLSRAVAAEWVTESMPKQLGNPKTAITTMISLVKSGRLKSVENWDRREWRYHVNRTRTRGFCLNLCGQIDPRNLAPTWAILTIQDGAFIPPADAT